MKNFLGKDGFNWWVGVVESRMDPLNLGRCRIRIFGWHTDNLQELPSDDLAWAHPLLPVNAKDFSNTPYENDWVVGFFMDGESGQFPVYFGVLPGIPSKDYDTSKGFTDQRTESELQNIPVHDYARGMNEPTTSRLFRNEDIDKTIIQKIKDDLVKSVTSVGTTWSQPEPSYNTKPPYNEVLETESGHIMEFDDSKDAERVHIAHRTGTHIEMRPDGSKVTRIVKDNYEIISGDDFVVIQGTCNITVNGTANLQVDGTANVKVGGDTNLQVDGTANVKVGGDTKMTVGGQVDLTASGNVNGKAPNFNLTGDLNVTGKATISQSLAVGLGITTGTGGTGNMTVNGSAAFTGDVVAAGKSLDNHIHADPQGGHTSPPL